MKQVFVDSGAFFALQVAQDASHAAAAEVFARAQNERWGLTTTNAVVIETYALLLSRTRTGRAAATHSWTLWTSHPCMSNASAPSTKGWQ